MSDINILRHRIEELGITRERLSELIGVSKSTIYRALNKPSRYKDTIEKIESYVSLGETMDNFEPEEEPTGETVTRKEDGTISATKRTTENPANLSMEKIAELFELDTDKWECTGYTAKSWNTSMKGEDGKPTMTRNYSVKGVFKPIVKVEPKREDIKWVFEEAQKQSNAYEYVKPKQTDKNDKVLVLPVLDAHIGKLAWRGETDENYDIKIAVNRFREAVVNIVTRAQKEGFYKIIFPLGNDFFQYDNIQNETTKGTRVDSDIRWKKLFKVGVELLKNTLDYCSSFAPVDVILVQGNHDNAMSFYAFESLRGWYFNNPFVTIDHDIKTRTYRQIGVNLIGFTHGDKERDNLYRLMQQEARELWGKTKYSEWVVGHLHKSYLDEKQGVRKRVVGSMTGTDAWHYEQGYIGSLKATQGIIYHKKQTGPYLIIHESVNVEEEEGQE